MLFYQLRKEGRLKVIETFQSEPVVSDGICVPWLYPAVSPDDRLLAYRSGGELRVVDRETGQG
jgi:hypothetical protein